MPQIKKKVTLQNKGDEAYVSVKQLMVSLKWTAAVDLDLMAFYRAKDGRTGGVFSENYTGGSLGSLNSFPFIQLSGDEGVSAKGGENEEILRVTKLDDLVELYICTINFTDASQSRTVPFRNYDAVVNVIDDKGEAVTVPLDSPQAGSVAVIARIDNSGFMGAKLVNENRIMDIPSFKSTIPGASTLNLASKIELKNPGDSVRIKAKTSGKIGEIVVNLNWNQKGGSDKPKGWFGGLLGGGSTGIDLDLGCLFELIDGRKGAIQALGNSFGSFDTPPYIFHCGDDRTGAWSEGENLRINGNQISQIKRILVYSFIYEGIANWSQADGIITIKQPNSPEIVVKLDNPRDGQGMCAIALFENFGGEFQVKKAVQYFQGHEPMDQAFSWRLR